MAYSLDLTVNEIVELKKLRRVQKNGKSYFDINAFGLLMKNLLKKK
jgi:hypothetical protein